MKQPQHHLEAREKFIHPDSLCHWFIASPNQGIVSHFWLKQNYNYNIAF